MVRHADHADHHGLDMVLRANQAALLSLLWAGLTACVVISAAYDIGGWVGAW